MLMLRLILTHGVRYSVTPLLTGRWMRCDNFRLWKAMQMIFSSYTKKKKKKKTLIDFLFTCHLNRNKRCRCACYRAQCTVLSFEVSKCWGVWGHWVRYGTTYCWSGEQATSVWCTVESTIKQSNPGVSINIAGMWPYRKFCWDCHCLESESTIGLN